MNMVFVFMYTFMAFMAFAAGLVWLGLLFWLGAALFFRGRDLSAFDDPRGEQVFGAAGPSDELHGVLASLADMNAHVKRAPRRRRVAATREAMDNLSGAREFDASFTPVDCAGVPAEWVLAPGADGLRRTLYIHGGAFIAGSPLSHRTLTSRFSEITGGAVLAVDYRLMPEYSRMAGIRDCRTAYRWLLDHGPDGPRPAQTVFVAGDSAGGNLALSLIAWIRDRGLRAPAAAVALSPVTDITAGSPSLRANLDSDPMLGPAFAPLARMPRALLLWLFWLQNRISPREPVISPVYGDLSGLPPVLVQISGSEMLRDDGRRYVNRARAAGSPARLQVWPHMVHVWQMFNPELPEARQALDEVRRFLATPAPAVAGPA